MISPIKQINQPQNQNVMAFSNKTHNVSKAKSKDSKQVECTWKKVRLEFTPQWRELLEDHTWINNPIV